MASIFQKTAEQISSTFSTNKSLVLVTGASGFVAAHVLSSFLDAGYRVRGTVRSEKSAAQVKSTFAKYANSTLEFAIVPDITTPGAFDEAVKGVDGVIHTASPFVLEVEDNQRDLLDPAIKGTTEILRAVQKNAPQVKRVVITSSFAAIVDPAKGMRPGYTYTEADWNPVTMEEAKTGSGPVAYCASKKFGELAALNFVKEQKPNFTISTINPPMVYGPVNQGKASIDSLNTSAADIYRFMNGSTQEPGDTAFPTFADVRDVGLAHLKAYERPTSGRYFITGGSFQTNQVCQILKKNVPSVASKVPDPSKTATVDTYKVDNSKTAEELGMTWIGLEKCITDTANSLVALEARA